MVSPAWLRVARDNLRFVRHYSGNRIFGFIALVLLSGYAEGFGIAMFLPIFAENLAGHTDPASRAVIAILHAFGAKPTLTSALPVVAVFFVAKGLLLYGAGVAQNRLSAKLTLALRRELVGALAVTDYRYVAQQSAGSMTNLVVTEVGRATSAFMSFSRLVPNVANVVVFFGILVLLDWQLTIAMTVVGGVVLIAMRLPSRLTRQMSARTTAANIRLSGLLIAMMQSFKYLVATGRFSRFRGHANDAAVELADANYRIGVLYALTGALAQPVMAVFLTGIVYWQVVIAGKSLATMLLVLIYMYRVMLELFAYQAQWQEVAAVSAGLAVTTKGIAES